MIQAHSIYWTQNQLFKKNTKQKKKKNPFNKELRNWSVPNKFEGENLMRLQHNIHLTQNQYSFQNKPNQQNKTKIIATKTEK